VPFYLAANQRLVRDVRQGALVTMADIEIASGSVLLALRQAQDAAFFGRSAAA
jgi:Predicted homoserine dehydrogenase